jgi:hypothetical protein
MYLSNGVSWFKLTDIKDCLSHPEKRIFIISCVMIAKKNDFVDINRYKKCLIFFIIQRISDLIDDTKDRLTVDTINYFFSSASLFIFFIDAY